MSLVYRPNIEELANAIESRKPFHEPNFYSYQDRTHALFKLGKIESMVNNIFVFDKQDITDLAIISEMSTFGFKVIETMEKILVSASLSDVVHLFKNCPDRTKFINILYENILAYYQPEYFRQLIDFKIMDSNKFSISYKDKVINSTQDITLESISLFHCDLFTYSLTHHFDEVKPSDNNSDEYILSRDKENYICNSFGEAYSKLNISFFHLSKILNISYFIYRVSLDEISDFINKNNISKFSLFRTIDIMGKTRNDVVLVTTSLYDFMSTFQLYKNNLDIYNSLSDGFKSIIDDMEALFQMINNAMINTIDIKNQLSITETDKMNSSIKKKKEQIFSEENIEKYIDEIVNPIHTEEDDNSKNQAPIEGEFNIRTDGGRNLFRDVKAPEIMKMVEEENPSENKKQDGVFKRIVKAILNK